MPPTCIRAAQPGIGGPIGGRVQTPDGRPIAGVAVTLAGAAHAVTASDDNGRFSFAQLSPGIYYIAFDKAGFERSQRTDILVTASPLEIDTTLAPSSFSSLQTIGSTSTYVTGRIQINTGTPAMNVISTQDFVDQGSTQVTKVLEETPGVSLASNAAGGGSNHASLGAPEYPQIRGSLPYETESLIDGHATSVGAIGTFSPLLVFPSLLQSVEVAKGPGSMPAEINYAIGGTVNYRTLEPTRQPESSADIGIDRYGGVSTTLKATGSTANHVLDYAFALATLGAPGPLYNDPAASSQLFLAFGSRPWTIDGQQVPGVPVFEAPAPTGQYAGGGAVRFVDPLYLCCSPVSTGFNSRAQLGKLRFNLSEQTALTLSYWAANPATTSPAPFSVPERPC